jgi:hypothetical protein
MTYGLRLLGQRDEVVQQGAVEVMREMRDADAGERE